MMVGVTDVEKALVVYQDILGFDTIMYDKTGTFEDLAFLRAGNQQYRRVLLTNKQPRKGPFSSLFGPGYIELVVALERQPRKIFEGRYWGDPGYIQICMDTINMRELEAYCQSKGFPFTVDSCAGQSQFDMGEASGHFTYIEDPDGTLGNQEETGCRRIQQADSADELGERVIREYVKTGRRSLRELGELCFA